MEEEMNKSEVIERLQKVSTYFKSMLKVGWQGDADIYREHRTSVKMAINLLKEQEAVEPDVDSEGTCTCGNCGETVGYYPYGSKVPKKLCKYCPECGQAVKWIE